MLDALSSSKLVLSLNHRCKTRIYTFYYFFIKCARFSTFSKFLNDFYFLLANMSNSTKPDKLLHVHKTTFL